MIMRPVTVTVESAARRRAGAANSADQIAFIQSVAGFNVKAVAMHDAHGDAHGRCQNDAEPAIAYEAGVLYLGFIKQRGLTKGFLLVSIP